MLAYAVANRMLKIGFSLKITLCTPDINHDILDIRFSLEHRNSPVKICCSVAGWPAGLEGTKLGYARVGRGQINFARTTPKGLDSTLS